MGKKLKIGDIEEYKFYWTPPKKFYDDNPSDKFFAQEFTFVFYTGDIGSARKSGSASTEDYGLVVTSNSLENNKEDDTSYDPDSLRDMFSSNYFFEIKQSLVPNSAKRAVFVFLLDEHAPLHDRIKEL